MRVSDETRLSGTRSTPFVHSMDAMIVKEERDGTGDDAIRFVSLRKNDGI